MEARFFTIIVCAGATLSMGASHRTANFIVSAQRAEFAQAVCNAAEQYRRDLAIEWLGRELPRWPEPCPISVQSAPGMGAGGATTFAFNNGQPFGWTMSVQGSEQRILDSVLPHEVTHTIFATHFGRPLPRWADEGACTTVEHISEKTKQHHLLIEALTTNRGISFNRMFAMREYPPDMLPLYAQGYSLARFLIAQKGKRNFIKYIGDGMQDDDWPRATRQHFGFQNISDLQVSWLEWVRKGSSQQQAKIMLASRMGTTNSRQRDPVLRQASVSREALTRANLRDPAESWYAQQSRLNDDSILW